jgi:hypothetical protein
MCYPVAISLETRLRTGLPGFDSGHGQGFISSSPPRPDRLWAHPASSSMGTESSFNASKVTGGVKLTSHLHVVPRLRMRGAILPLPIYLHGVVLS